MVCSGLGLLVRHRPHLQGTAYYPTTHLTTAGLWELPTDLATLAYQCRGFDVSDAYADCVGIDD